MGDMVFHAVVLALVTVGTAGLCLVLERVWPSGERRRHNDVLGWQFSVLGSIYAIILGFMLYTVWNNFQLAKQNVGSEANSLVNLSRLAPGLPVAERARVEAATEQYAEVMVSQEWPAMERSELPPASRVLVRELWNSLIAVKPGTVEEQAVLDHSFTELASLTEHRRLREIQVYDRLPTILWVVLLSGGALVLTWSSLFGAQNLQMHAVLVATLAFLLTLMLQTIAAIDRPFQGTVQVPVAAFQRAAESMKSY